MKKPQPKFSILIPSYNGIKYLPTCLESILKQDYADYELIISDDHSTDGTKAFLEKLDHPNVTVIEPAFSLSMTEHWEWLLSHAQGEWCIFVGQDDGLQPYFFVLAELLVQTAKQKKLRSIMSSRAYFFWPGCEYVYGNVAVRYLAFNQFKVHNFKVEVLKTLLSLKEYFELPQMYTTALFHKDLIAEAKQKQQGKVFSCHPQDANLAAVACSLETHYLKSYIPLGWVGSSPKSAGMAVTGQNELADEKNKDAINRLKKDYMNKISNSSLKYHESAGDFSFGNATLYFWQAILMTADVRPPAMQKLLTSKGFKYFMFAGIYYHLLRQRLKDQNPLRLQQFEQILAVNQCNLSGVKLCLGLMLSVFLLLLLPLGAYKVLNKILRISADKIKLLILWNDNPDISLMKASADILMLIKNKNWVSPS